MFYHQAPQVLLLLLVVTALLTLLSGKPHEASSPTVTIIEFCDFQCPYRKQAAGMVERLRGR